MAKKIAFSCDARQWAALTQYLGSEPTGKKVKNALRYLLSLENIDFPDDEPHGGARVGSGKKKKSADNHSTD